MIARFERFCGAISAISRYVQRIMADELEKYGLKGSYAVYLIALGQHPDGLTATELCDICEKDKAAVSRALTAMEQKHLILRNTTGHSPYRTPVTLTEEGLKASKQLEAKAILAVELAGQGLTDEARATFYSSLETITSNLESISKEGIPQP